MVAPVVPHRWQRVPYVASTKRVSITARRPSHPLPPGMVRPSAGGAAVPAACPAGDVHPGQHVDIHLMGEDRPLSGHVGSIAAGIEDRYRSNGASLLPNVTPAFDWVRLAQRIPVRIVIDRIPAGVRLIAGRTATVNIDDKHAPARPAAGKTQAGRP